SPGNLVNGVATFTTSTLSVGMHDVTARFSGNASFTTSNSTTLSQTVTRAATTTTVTVSPTTITFPQTVTLTATVAGSPPSTSTPIVPTGTAIFTDVTDPNNPVMLGSSTLAFNAGTGNDEAVLTTTTGQLSAGLHVIE